MKSPLRQIKNIVEIHTSRLEKVDDKTSGLKDKRDIKEKTEEFLDKRLKHSERNMQELL
jgi:hypothetical protein